MVTEIDAVEREPAATKRQKVIDFRRLAELLYASLPSIALGLNGLSIPVLGIDNEGQHVLRMLRIPAGGGGRWCLGERRFNRRHEAA